MIIYACRSPPSLSKIDQQFDKSPSISDIICCIRYPRSNSEEARGKDRSWTALVRHDETKIATHRNRPDVSPVALPLVGNARGR